MEYNTEGYIYNTEGYIADCEYCDNYTECKDYIKFITINPCNMCKQNYIRKGLINFSCGYCGLVIDYVNNTIHNPPTIPNPEPILLHKTEDGISICSICKTTSLEEKMKQIRMIEPCEWLNDYTNFKEYMEICD